MGDIKKKTRDLLEFNGLVGTNKMQVLSLIVTCMLKILYVSCLHAVTETRLTVIVKYMHEGFTP